VIRETSIGTGTRRGAAERDTVAAGTLLACGVAAGPVYVGVTALLALASPGFDPSRHAASMLALGPYGGAMVANFLVVGVLVLACALGMRRALAAGRGSAAVPALLAVHGAALVLSGVFPADAGFGYPPGAPAGPAGAMSAAGGLHMAAGGVAFLALVAAALVWAARERRFGSIRWAAFSVSAALLYLVGFGAIAASAGAQWANLLLTLAVVVGWVWLSATAARVRAGRAAAVAK
jgi:hypothetical membrane protein